MKICRMTEKGRLPFTQFLDSLRTDQPRRFPVEILSSSVFAAPIGGDTKWLDEIDLDDSLQAAKGFDKIVSQLDLKSAERDWGFWTWCSAYLFERLCKRDISNRYRPGELAIWIADPQNWKRYYRHYLASIWQVYSAHRELEEKLVVLLTGPVNTPGELWAQVAATQTLITNESMIDAIYQLFWDKQSQCRKRGAGGTSPRRLTQVLKQFEKTYDFYSMSGDQIVNMLPAEFERYKETTF